MTWQTTSSDGFHVFFRYPTKGRIASRDLAPGVQIISDGHNLVAPGSIHPEGHRYYWTEFYSPDLIPLADAPLWLLDLMRSQGHYTEAVDKPVAHGNASKATPPRPRDSLLALPALSQGSQGVPGFLDGAKVSALFAEWWAVERCLKVLGLEQVRVGEKFWYILHPEQHPSAAIVPPRHPGEHFVYGDFHHRSAEPLLLPLPLVYYCKMTGAPTTTRLNTPSFLVWSLRLLEAAGVIAGVPLPAPKLKGPVPEGARRLYAGFLHLLSLRWLVDPKVPSPFTWNFAADWLPGVTQKAIRSGMKFLIAIGQLHAIGRDEKGTTLFLFGSRTFIRHRTGRRGHKTTPAQVLATAEETGQEAIITAVAQDLDAMLAPEEKACPECGVAGYIDSKGSWDVLPGMNAGASL